MSSGNDDDTRKTSDTQQGGYPQSQHYPPQQMGYPPATMGYPPPPGPYPPTAANYNPYPYHPHNNHHGYYPNPNIPYQQHPAHMHHQNNQNNRPIPIPAAPSPVVGFIRCVLTTIIVLIMVSCVCSIILYILLRPVLPQYHVASLAVSNFNISNGVVAGNWDANITVTNPNTNQKVDFSHMQAYMYYQNIINYLSWSTISGLSLGTNSTSTVHVKNTMTNQAQPQEWTVKTLEDDWTKGEVRFELGMTMLGTFRGSWWVTHLSLGVYCDELTVKFKGGKAGSGSTLDGGLPKKCVVDA